MTESPTIALWGLAEQFVSIDPGKSIICLQAALQEPLPHSWEVKTRIRLAELLLAHTTSTEDAKDNLTRAVRVFFSFFPPRSTLVSVLARIMTNLCFVLFLIFAADRDQRCTYC
jgi:hypothetical protein